MIGYTRDARDQIRALINYYLEVKGRADAANSLYSTLIEAESTILAHPSGGLPYPRPYPAMQALGFRWLKVRSYWIGWTIQASRPIVTNVLYASANMPDRASTRVEFDEP